MNKIQQTIDRLLSAYKQAWKSEVQIKRQFITENGEKQLQISYC